jgi:23S rRNA pseudouridine955/2504/2580 synthase
VRGRHRGPRQPGGGKQIAGPRYSFSHVRHHPEVAAKRPPKGDGGQAGKSRLGKSWPEIGSPISAGRSSFEARRGRVPQDDGRQNAAPRGEGSEHRGVQNVSVTDDESGMRVDRFLQARIPDLSFARIQRAIRKGEVRVDGKRVDANDRLQPGQMVRIPPLRAAAAPRLSVDGAADETLDFLKSITLYEDADVLVLNKPMGLAVQGGSGTTRHVDGLLEAMRDARGQRPRLVHRLDKDTAGCLLVAKTRFAAAALAKSFRSRSARKIYWALVAGVPKPRQGRISTFLAKEQREEESMMRIARHGEEGASHAVTYYAVVDTAGPALAWLSLKPVTGRTHQLRAHMAHIGHPIVGDAKYFSRENWQLPGGMQNRLHLLARRIAIPHPRGGVIDVTAPLPPHMQQSWNLLGLDAKRYDPIEEAPLD